MKQIAFLLVAFVLIYCSAQTKSPEQNSNAKNEIRAVLKTQQDAWNEGDIDKFMEGYCKSDSMQFVGGTIRQGWQATLERYKQTYPDRAAMGTLQFDIWQVVIISEDACLLTGKYTLMRANDQPSGPFTLIFRVKNGKWVITYDHTC